MLVIVEDNKAHQLLLQALLNMDCELRIYETLMSAAADIPLAKGVILDWFLADGVKADEVGAIDVLVRKGIPFVIYTSADLSDIPASLRDKVVTKDQRAQLVETASQWFADESKRTSNLENVTYE